jgi:hypothetical protein
MCSAEPLLTQVTHMPLLCGVSFLMFQQVAPAPEPQLTTLAHMLPFLIVPVHVSYRLRGPRVRFPAVRFVIRVDTICLLLLQGNSKFMCIRDNGIHVRLHNAVFLNGVLFITKNWHWNHGSVCFDINTSGN